MSSAREAILQAVVAVLGNSTPVYRSRVEALSQGDLPAIVVMPGDEQVSFPGRGMAQRNFNVLVEFHAQASATLSADQVIDPLIVAAHAALMLNDTLGGKTARLIEQGMSQPEFYEGDDTRAHVTVTYTAVYATPSGDIARLI